MLGRYGNEFVAEALDVFRDGVGLGEQGQLFPYLG